MTISNRMLLILTLILVVAVPASAQETTSPSGVDGGVSHA